VWVCIAWQAPLPSQDAPVVATPDEQLADRQEVTDPGYAQAVVCVPSQVPPQAEPSEAHAAREPCGEPFATVQVPTRPSTSQAWHWPSQATSQHTPSTHSPLEHCDDRLQVLPSVSFGSQLRLEQ
jgi:hypothetical protein